MYFALPICHYLESIVVDCTFCHFIEYYIVDSERRIIIVLDEDVVASD